MRKSGYYWVRHKNYTFYAIGYYFQEFEAWRVFMFIDSWLFDSDFSEIDEKEIKRA